MTGVLAADPLVPLALVAAGIVAAGWATGQRDARWWAGASAVGALVLAGLATGPGWARTSCLDAAALIAGALIRLPGTVGAMRAARVYLQLLLPALAAAALAQVLLGSLAAAWGNAIVGLVVVGFALKLALVPLYAWLPLVAEHAAPLTTALVVGLVDVAAFLELAHLRVVHPEVVEPARALWLGLALLSMLGGSLLALAQQDLKRFLAFSSIDDMGHLLVGVIAGPGAGMAGALRGAANHAVSKLLLFGAVAAAEADSGKPLTLQSRGMASRHPVAAAAFLVGAFGVLGIPPTAGFGARWRLYEAGLTCGGPALLAAMLVASGLAVLGYARALHCAWLGWADATDAGEPRRSRVVLTGIILLALLGAR